MKQLKNYLLTLLIIGVSNAYGFEILSKKETERTFGKSFIEWKIDANKLSASGMGEMLQSNEISVTMIVFVRSSILKVTPAYTKDNLIKPWKITVGIEQNPELSKLTKQLGEEGMRQLVYKWHREMLPEYTVMTEFDLVGETLQINFNIFEYGTNQIIDSVGKETQGCWQGCIKK